MLATLAVLASDHRSDDAGIDVSPTGLILGVLLGALVFLFLNWALSQDTRTARAAFPVAIIVALIVFFLLGFDLYD